MWEVYKSSLGLNKKHWFVETNLDRPVFFLAVTGEPDPFYAFFCFKWWRVMFLVCFVMCCFFGGFKYAVDGFSLETWLTTWGFLVGPILYKVLAPSQGGEPDILHQQYITLERCLKWLVKKHPRVLCAALIRGEPIFTAKTLPTVLKFGSWSRVYLFWRGNCRFFWG